MSTSVNQIDRECKIADYVTLPQLETIIPSHVIQEVLTECDAWEERERKLNMLFPGVLDHRIGTLSEM